MSNSLYKDQAGRYHFNRALICGYKGEPHMYYDLNLVVSGSHFIHRSSVPLTVLERVVGASIMDIGVIRSATQLLKNVLTLMHPCPPLTKRSQSKQLTS